MTIIATREIDKQGRVQLPTELRREKIWVQGDLMVFYKSGNSIVIDVCEKARQPRCLLCGEPKCKLLIDSFGFCESCVELLRDEIDDIGQHANLNATNQT